MQNDGNTVHIYTQPTSWDQYDPPEDQADRDFSRRTIQTIIEAHRRKAKETSSQYPQESKKKRKILNSNSDNHQLSLAELSPEFAFSITEEEMQLRITEVRNAREIAKKSKLYLNDSILENDESQIWGVCFRNGAKDVYKTNGVFYTTIEGFIYLAVPIRNEDGKEDGSFDLLSTTGMTFEVFEEVLARDQAEG